MISEREWVMDDEEKVNMRVLRAFGYGQGDGAEGRDSIDSGRDGGFRS